MAAEMWVYRIEAYRWKGFDGAWERANDANANSWFLFGQKGEDKRVFGVFESRLGAEDAANQLANGQLGDKYRGAIKDGPEDFFERALAESASRPLPNNEKEKER